MHGWGRSVRLARSGESRCRAVRASSSSPGERELHDARIRSQSLGSPAITDRSSRITLAEQLPQLEIDPEIVGMLALHSLEERGRIAIETAPTCSECDDQRGRLLLNACHLGHLGKTLHPVPPVRIANAIAPGVRIHASSNAKDPVSHLLVRTDRPVVQCGDERLSNRRRFQSHGHAIRVFPRVSEAPFAKCHDVATARLGVSRCHRFEGGVRGSDEWHPVFRPVSNWRGLARFAREGGRCRPRLASIRRALDRSAPVLGA